jgi:hypothetical protein
MPVALQLTKETFGYPNHIIAKKYSPPPATCLDMHKYKFSEQDIHIYSYLKYLARHIYHQP